MNPVICLNNVTKNYGKQRGVTDLNLEVKPGEIFGYLGPNGAGKTTTIRLLLDLIRPTSGTITVLGRDLPAQALEVRRLVGYIPGDPKLYGALTGLEQLTYSANLRGGVDWGTVDSLAERLDCDLSRRIETLSHGNRQKVAIIRAFMHQPELLILDEPTSGLDPLMQQEFDRIVGEVKAEGRTVFLSSHIIPEVEALCDRVCIIRAGQIITVENVETLKSRTVRRIQIEFGDTIDPDDFANLEGLQNMTVGEKSLRCDIQGSLDALIKRAAQNQVLNVITYEPDLEDAFLAYYGTGGNHDAP